MKTLKLDDATLNNLKYFLSLAVVPPGTPFLEAAAQARELESVMKALNRAIDEPAKDTAVLVRGSEQCLSGDRRGVQDGAAQKICSSPTSNSPRQIAESKPDSSQSKTDTLSSAAL